MNEFLALLIPALLGVLILRLLMLPMKLIFKLAVHALGGFTCLWLLNWVSGFTGIYFPINAVTSLIAGILGLPGIALLALLELL